MQLCRRTFSILLSAAILCCTASLTRGQTSPSASAEVLTLERALEMAAHNNLQVKGASLGVSKAEEELAAARALRFPTFRARVLGLQPLVPIDFNFDRGVFGYFPGIGPVPAELTTLRTPTEPTAVVMGQISQPLSKLFRIDRNIAELQLNRDFTREGIRQEQQEIRRSVKQAYFAILQTQSALESAGEDVKFYREIDRETDAQLAQQLALKSDSLEVKVRLAKAEYNQLVLDDQLAIQKQHLNHLMGRDLLTQFSVSPVPDPSEAEVDLAAARLRALDQRPELRQARLKLKEAEEDRRAKKSEFFPEANFSLQYISPRNFNDIVPKNIFFVGVDVNWDVFDWGRKKHELTAKDLAIEQSRETLRDAETGVLVEVEDKFRKLKQSRQLLRIAQLSQEASTENARVIAARYQQEASLIKDVLQTQSALEQANSQYQQALTSLWMAMAEFEKALGEDH